MKTNTLLWLAHIPILWLGGRLDGVGGYTTPSAPRMEEICDNGIDDDSDGLIDLNDPDCECPTIVPASLIPNPSFEDQSCCPVDRAELYCADGWIQASAPTTDYLHTCGWMGPNDFPPPFPFPDGQGVVGLRDGRVRNGQNPVPETNWKEYAGACLLSPLVAGNTYRFEFDVGFVDAQRSPPIRITFFGTRNCSYLPFGGGNEAFGCPTNGANWIELGSTLVSGGSGNIWKHAAIEVTPNVNIAAIAIGPPCQATSSSVSTYYFFDNLILADFASFGFRIQETAHPCDPDFSLQIQAPGTILQWYKDGIALVGETASRLSRMYGDGAYQVRLTDATGCRVTQAYLREIPTLRTSVHETICHEATYPFGGSQIGTSGTYIDTLTSVNQCDSIVTLELAVRDQTTDTLSARIFEGESYTLGTSRYPQAGEYWTTLASSQGCDSLVLLLLDYYRIYIPNAFSPNQDGVNDHFEVQGDDNLLQHSHLSIYDRWGGQVYTGERWDGRYRGEFVQPGIYTYVAQVVMDDGVARQFRGAVTVVK